ncbi:CML14 [Symbiodinium microadriaticum]|nr:CML14 [Symbiodinium sp. KB8]CAE7385795.1 CML14 [Symbiodinium microadriaticum]
MPAGCIKVALENDSVKYVQPEQAATVLRPEEPEPKPEPPLPRSAQDQSHPAPTGRADAGAARLEARDRWNTYEIRLQEIFMEYDRDNSGALEVEEFRALLRDFNEGRDPTEEEHAFMMKLSDKDGDGRISLGELHYALRAWHSYRHMDDSLLRLFAEFDFDESGHLSVAELERLLTAMNGNKPVPRHEVFRVMQEADTLGDHVIHRAELLGAISAWYGNVDRKDTDLPSLLREALARTIQDADYSGALDQGRSAFGVAASMVKGFVGYSQVDDGQQPLAGASWPPPAQGAGSSGPLPMMSDPSLSQQPVTFRMVKAMPLLLSSCSKFCYVGFPFIFGIVLVFAGWEHRDSVCPRNLDGILMWFGFLTLVFSGLAYVTDPNAVVGRIAVLTILVVLNLVGFLWTSDPEVDRRKGACGLSLVYFSYLVWTTVPICSLGYLGFLVATHVKKLQRKDEHLQNEVIPVVL